MYNFSCYTLTLFCSYLIKCLSWLRYFKDSLGQISEVFIYDSAFCRICGQLCANYIVYNMNDVCCL